MNDFIKVERGLKSHCLDSKSYSFSTMCSRKTASDCSNAGTFIQWNPDVKKCQLRDREMRSLYLTGVGYIGAFFHTFYYYWADQYLTVIG